MCTTLDDQPENEDDSEFEIENECANYKLKPKKQPSQPTISSFFPKQ